MSALCPSCGKEVEKGFCDGCFLRLHPIKLKELLIKTCKCGRYFQRVGWRDDLEKSLGAIVKKNLTIANDLELVDVRILSQEATKKKISVELEIRVKYGKELVIERVSSVIKIEKSQCDRCHNRPEYYEAIVQLRGSHHNVRIEPKQISKVVKVRGGIDFYLKERGYARQIAREFKKQDFQIKESEKVVGITKTGKRSSRLSISVKPREK